jgi:4-amino-4-deoxy-L-arabinose transferase-like glycosyltransferase
MAVDIARHGTPLHVFRLAPAVAGWDLPVWPVAPVGYVPPDPGTGVAATVWPPGYSAALAMGYRVGGEAGLYILTPLVGLAALAALWWLCLEVLRTWEGDWRFLAAGIAVFVLATSYEQIDRLSVPMADIPAQLFTMLTVGFALRATRGESILNLALTGVCLGVAFALRYTQALMVFCVLLVWVLYLYRQRPRPWRRTLTAMAFFGGAAWLVALPVLRYHQVAFDGPFRVGGTAELALFGWEHIPGTLVKMTGRFLSPLELLYLTPFLVWGVIQTWRDARRGTVALLAWLAVIVVFHLPYPALRMRDLLSVLPVFAIWVGAGMAGALAQVQHIHGPGLRTAARALVLCLMIVGLWARCQVTIWLPVHARDFQTFGYLRAEQRAAFDELANLTSADGIVAASLNGGAVSLYAKRDIARPAYWSPDDWLRFVDRALRDGRTVYLLVDGLEMQDPLGALSARYPLRQVASLSMPYFSLDGTSEIQDVPLYRVVKATAD